VVVPTLVALLTAGAVASATSAAPAATANRPALVTQASAVPLARDDTLDRTSRLLPSGRTPLVAAGSDAEAEQIKRAAAKKEAEAQQEAAEEKAADEKAADEKAADKKAADKKAADKKAADEKAAEKKADQKKKDGAQANNPTAAQLRVKGERYTRVSLSVRTQPKSSADLVTVLRTGSKLKVTDTTRGTWTLVIHRSKGRWVHSEYLVKKKPAKRSSSSSGGISMAPCSSGSSMESGLTKDAIRVHRAVCSRYPSIKSYGGMRSGGGSFHSSGRAVDIMVSGSKGQDVADWVRANRKQLGVSEIIYAQKIWTVQRGGEGWRSMSSRGNATANHYDHVHVSVYGNSATG
jgi:hypothetical protein